MSDRATGKRRDSASFSDLRRLKSWLPFVDYRFTAQSRHHVYSLLYESFLSWYAGRRTPSPHSHLYAVATLAAIAFVNIASLVVLCAYMDFAWARALLLLGRAGPFSLLLALALLGAHLFLFRRRSSFPQLPKRRQAQMRWIGTAYALLSLVIFLYISALVATRL
jgi:hypothetical protein